MTWVGYKTSISQLVLWLCIQLIRSFFCFGPGDYVYVRALTNSGWIEACFSKWCLIVALSRKGLEETPNTTRVNLRMQTSVGSLATSSTQRNLRTSWSLFATDTIKKAFSISAVRVTRWVLNLSSMSKNCWSNFGLVYRHSLSNGPSDFADASWTILNFVVSLSCRTTAWCRR